jgi:hypothetical protein
VADGSDADSVLRFWLERGGDGMKRCRKMKRRQQARLGSMGRKCDMVRWHCDVDWRISSTGKETTSVGLTSILLD